jgi:hypothetical protein
MALSYFLELEECQSHRSPSPMLEGGKPPPWGVSEPFPVVFCLWWEPRWPPCHFAPKTLRHHAPESSGAELQWAPYGTAALGLCTTPVGRVWCESSTQRWRVRIRSSIPFHFNKILATRIKINGWDWSTMLWTHELKPWTRSMRPWDREPIRRDF